MEAALARFRQVGDRWGRAAVLPMRARLRRYDDLDGALADLREARTSAGEFGSLSLGDQLYGDLRWIDVHVRRGDTAFPADHARTLVAGARAALRLALGDPSGAEEALREAYAAALATRELPALSLVTVNAAALAEARGRQRESAVLLGAAARLRGTHDRTDPQVRELTRRGRTALGEDEFAAAYAKGWELDTRAAVDAARAVFRSP
ncbi:hypothetical protein ACIBIZ_13980 [Nonomuraea spiralis]|uniref:hypothetical protein n=1 Tax=Nonomuraea spiralis TaxID=46182 RepID=UPI0037B52F34